MTHECPFCTIAAGEIDDDLVVLRTANVVVIPTLKQRRFNPGQMIVLPIAHVTALHTANPSLRKELFDVVARILEATPRAFGSFGSTVLNNNEAPDQVLEHLHVHVIPRHSGDNLVIPNPDSEPAPRQMRSDLASRLRHVLTDPGTRPPPPAAGGPLATTDTIELGELLTFLADWFSGTDTEQLAASLRRFVGTEGYDLTQLRNDLARFTFLLGTDDGTQLFGTDQH
jgi:histidine triad (HIT) family protein